MDITLGAPALPGVTAGGRNETVAPADEKGQAIRPDMQSAARLYRDACTQGDLRGCADLGNLYQLGHGVAENYAQARSLFRKACDGGEMAWVRPRIQPKRSASSAKPVRVARRMDVTTSA